ncbi:MAG: aminopeptidase P family protein [Finegoldia sp.]|nr:aminopeptidase P family protein [Finegoldia sp.]
MIKERLEKLRKKMGERNIEAYIILTSDPHSSEYIADYYKTREYISGFSGSAGSLVVTRKSAALFTDGRYFIQAERELAGSGIDLMKMGEPGVGTLIDYLVENTSDCAKIGVDGLSLDYEYYYELINNIGIHRMLITDIDLVGEIWEDRPELPKEPAYSLDLKYCGESAGSKIERLRDILREKSCDYDFIGSLDDICYLYNIRGNDVTYNPVVMSYALVGMDFANLYIDAEKVDEDLKKNLQIDGISLKRYDDIYQDLSELSGTSVLFIDPAKTNVKIYNSINSNVRLNKGMQPVSLMKAHKNRTEIKNNKNAYIKDGVALVKFFYWLSVGVPTGNVTEHSAAEKLRMFRQEGDLFKDLSFETISAYGENAALPHYSTPEIGSPSLKSEGLYLVDSGAQYLDGTTDITRTIALGPLTEEEKLHYTLTLKSHIALMTTIFPKGTKAAMLDPIARRPIWQEGLDFNHGTGHGVGFFLNVHEGPQAITKRDNGILMEEGMVTSDEPGIYVEGSHGIRIENIMVCVKKFENEFGEFLGFESLSICPIDTKPVIKERLTEEEIDWLNSYNKESFEKLSPYLEGPELEYLKKVTEAI